MAGDRSQRARIERLAKQLGIEVEFTGWVSSRRKAELLQKAWVCVYSSEIKGWCVVSHTPYGVSKLTADLYVQEYHYSYGLRTWFLG